MESDIIGASNTGVKSVWLNRNGIHSASSVKPDYEITSLSELLGGIDLTAEI
jgi:FMN phosphatase YigB (HAD superfamily)